MAVNQAQVDHIISTASADDPEVRLLKLQDEVELLKTSIKRLLIDIRERMNDIDNPFNIPSDGSGRDAPIKVANIQKNAPESGSPGEAAGTKTGGSQASQDSPERSSGGRETPPLRNPEESAPGPGALGQGMSETDSFHKDAEFVQALKTRIGIPAFGSGSPSTQFGMGEGKVRLQKVFRLFAWTTKNVKQYGHDRVDLMLESYRAMGYITSESCSLVKDIARLMPNSLGEEHDITAAEYVRELYELNHILDPGDDSLDRDMIEVFMHQRASGEAGTGKGIQERTGEDIQSRDMARKKDRI
jgi:hypothetical protein